MADVKTIQTRLQLKYDTYANWTDETQTGLGANLVLLKGEIGICEIPAADVQNPNNGSSMATTAPTVLFKVGDGTNPFKSLKWASALAADVYGWAKASDVVFDEVIEKDDKGNETGRKHFIRFKNGETVVKELDLSAFATDAEVAALTTALDARIAAIEGALGTDNGAAGSVSARLDSAETKLDDILGHEAEGETEAKVGLIDQALADAKSYTDEREVEINKAIDAAESAANSYADGIVATEKSEREAGDAALSDRIDAIVGTEGVEGTLAAGDKATLDAAKTYAKEYADGLAGNYDAAGSAADAEANAKAYADEELAKVVEAQEAIDAAQDEVIGKKLDKTTYEAYIAGKEMSDADLKKYAEDEADAAESAAIAAAKTETEKQVKALADGQVEANRAAIAAMDEAYKAADNALDGRLDTVEAKLANVSNVMDFIGAREVSVADGVITITPVDEETFNKGDVVVDSNGKEYVYDGNAWREFGYADANASAISGLLTRMGTAEDDIDQAQADIDALEEEIVKKLATETFNTWTAEHAGEDADHAGTATEITAEIAAAVNGEKALREAADKAINDKIGTLPTGEGAYATLVDGIADAKAAGSAAAGRLDVIEPKVTTLQDIVNGYEGKGSIKTAVDAAAELAQKGVDDAKKAQDEVDALELVVDGVKTTADNAKADLAALTGEGGRLTVAESNITTLQNIVNSGEGKTIRDDVTALQTLTGDASKGNEALYTELGRVAGLVEDTDTGLAATKAIADEAKSDAEDAQSRVAAIEADYLKSTDLFIFSCGSSTTNVHEQPVEQPAE